MVVFSILGFILWRRRRRWWRGNGRDITFVEPSIYKGFNLTEVLDVRPGGVAQRRKSPTQSLVSEVSLDIFPVTVPQVTNPQSKPSPPTLPRSPTISPLSPAPRRRDDGGTGLVHSPEAVGQYLNVQIGDPLQVDLESSPSPALNRRSTVPKPSGPRPPSYRCSTDDPQTLTDPTPTKGKGLPEPEMRRVGEGERSTIYSFLDMTSLSRPSSTIDGMGQSRNQPASQVNPDSPRHSLITRANSTQSYRDSDKRRESGTSKPLSLSVVIQQPPALKYPPSSEPHPYSPYFVGHQLSPQFHRPRTGEGVSPTESIPFTTSEVSEIRFRHPGESSEQSASRPASGSGLQPSPLTATATTSPIYRKLFGILPGEVPPDGLLAKKPPLHRRTLSALTFNTLPRP